MLAQMKPWRIPAEIVHIHPVGALSTKQMDTQAGSAPNRVIHPIPLLLHSARRVKMPSPNTPEAGLSLSRVPGQHQKAQVETSSNPSFRCYR